MMRKLTDSVMHDLGIPAEVDEMDIDALTQHGLFQAVDQRLIRRLLEKLGNQSITDSDVQRIVNDRKTMLWYDEFANEYQAISAASAFRAVLNKVEDHIELQSSQHGFESYVSHYYRVDQAYRHFRMAFDQAPDLDAIAISNDLEADYVRFQLDLGAAWQRQVNTMNAWRIPNVADQRDFFLNKVENGFLKSGRKWLSSFPMRCAMSGRGVHTSHRHREPVHCVSERPAWRAAVLYTTRHGCAAPPCTNRIQYEIRTCFG